MKMSGQELERLEDEEEDKETYYQFKRTQVAIGDLIDRICMIPETGSMQLRI